MTSKKNGAQNVQENPAKDTGETEVKESEVDDREGDLERAAESLITDSVPDSEGQDVGESETSEQSEFADLSDQELVEALIEANSQISEMQDSFLRAKAEMENIRRRAQNEVIAARKYALEGFAQEMLQVKDSLDQAAQVELDAGESSAVTNMKEGLGLTLKQLETVLLKFSVTEVEAGPGVKFDPELHQAISMVPSEEIESNHIIDVMQKGFVLKDRLLRPAMVIVAS